MTEPDKRLIDEAFVEAQRGFDEGGLPIGAVLADQSGRIVGRGHNLRVQTADPTAHAEVVALRSAGRRRDWSQLTLATTLSPCIMCSNTAILYRIRRVIVGDWENFGGAEALLAEHGIQVVRHRDARCVELMKRFIGNHPDLWREDIGR